MAGPVLVGSIDGQPHLHDVVTRGAQLAALLETDLIVGLCDLDSLNTTVSTSCNLFSRNPGWMIRQD